LLREQPPGTSFAPRTCQDPRRCGLTFVETRLASETPGHYMAMSLSFLSGRIFTTLRAGLALKIVGSPVNGLVP